jgi:hypothetical protein
MVRPITRTQAPADSQGESPQARETTAVRSLFYLYGVLDTRDVPRSLKERQLLSLGDAHPVYGLETGRLVAAVSRVPASQFAEAPLNGLMSDLASLAPYAVRHEEVIRGLISDGAPLVPMTFGTVYRSEAAIQKMLEARSDEIHELLESLRGKAEWTLKVFVSEQALKTAARRVSPTLKALDAQAAAAAPGRAYLLARQIEGIADSESDRVLADALNDIFTRLALACARGRLDDVAAGDGSEIQLVGKAAYLVAWDAATEFEQTLVAVEAEYAPLGLRLELTGPWAPYSFVSGETTASVRS